MRDHSPKLTPRHDFLIKLDDRVAADEFSIRIVHKSSQHSWANCFKRSFIEQLTKRTGNFKSFSTFVGMLGIVVNKRKDGKRNESLKVEILTLQDLQKMKQARKDDGDAVSSSEAAGAMNDLNKRYFILTYSTEFETTHYPLPLNYAGVEPTPETGTLTELTTYLNATETNELLETTQDTDIIPESAASTAPRLNSTQISCRGMPPLTRNAESITSNSSERHSSRRRKNSASRDHVEPAPINISQQVLIEKQRLQIRELEERLRKRGKMIKDLRAEVKTLGDEKKLLALSNKNLTVELAEYRRGFSNRSSVYSQPRGRSSQRGQQAPISRDSSPGATPRNASSSLRRSRSYDRPWRTNSRPASRSGSVERYGGNRPSSARLSARESRPYSRPSSATRGFERRPIIQRRSASASSRHSVASSGARSRNSSIGRFDPTAYVEQQQNKRRKAEIRKREHIRIKQARSARSPLPLYASNTYKGSPPRKNHVQANRKKHLGPPNAGKGAELFENSIDIDMADIDQRLNSLQQYINDLDE